MQGYARRLSKDSRDYFDREIGKIITRLYEIEGFNNNSLEENYLVGYYMQKEALKYRKKEENGNEDN